MNYSADNNNIPIHDSELQDLLLEYRRENWKGIQPEEAQKRIVEELIHGDSERPLRLVESYVRVSSESRILDLGSGVGSFVIACRRRGLKAFGVEPDRIGQGATLTAIQIARKRINDAVFVCGLGEGLPFPDRSMDVIVMDQVMEHVTDQNRVVREAARVVRDGGVIYIASPNYLRFYEPHYKIIWFPLLPKILGRTYLWLRKRSPSMLNQLTYTTNGKLRKLLANLGADFSVIDLHREQFLKKRQERTFAARSTRLMAALTRLPVAGPFLLQTILWYGSIAEGGCELVVLRRTKAAL